MKKAYFFVSGILFAFLVVFIFLNSLGALLEKYWAKQDERQNFASDVRHAQLVGLSLPELRKLKIETWSYGYEYEPWTGFRERPHQGQYVNIHPEGYRVTPGTPPNPERLVLLFGGSTMFGYNVTDSQTIAAYLQQMVNADPALPRIEIRNFGRAYYYSEQEYALLLQILKYSKSPPQVVVFLDGINEGFPYYTAELTEMFDAIQNQRQGGVVMRSILHGAPMSRVFRRIFPEFSRRFFKPNRGGNDLTWGQVVDLRFHVYCFVQESVRAICRLFKTEPFFFLQPVPGFHNEFTQHLPTDKKLAYQNQMMLMERLAALAPQGKIIDLSKVLSGYPGFPFVDDCHYAPEVNRMIAEKIYQNIRPALMK